MRGRRSSTGPARAGAVARRMAWVGLRAYARRRRRGPEAGRQVTILLMSAWGMGGTIRTVLTLAGELARRGYDVEIASVRRTRASPFFGEFPSGVKVTALDGDGSRRLPRPLRAALRRSPSVLMDHADHAAESCSLWTDLRLATLLRRRSGFVIGTRAGFNLMLARLALPGLVAIGQEHMNLTQKRPRIVEAIGREYRRLAAVATLTEGDARAYAELLDGQVRVAAIPNAVPAVPGPRASLDSTTVLAAGRLTRQKGFDLLIPAFGRVAADHPDWRLRICGRGPLRKELEEQIRAEGLAGRVELAGAVEDMGAEMAAASVYVLSSRYEGFPLVLLEAMTKGLPVVATDCPTGPAQLVEDHRNGILVPPRDIGALARGLRELIEDPELRRRCAAAGVETARPYSPEMVGARWDELLSELRPP